MKQKLLFLFLIVFVSAFRLLAQSSQEGLTFKIEELKRPDNLITEWSADEVIEKIAPNQWAHSLMPDSLIYLSKHPFFDGMFKAYAEHRPFVLSPDMIWLLISQGFSQHINNNAESLRGMFVNFEGRKDLVTKIDYPKSLKKLSTWEEVIPQFTKQVADNTSKDLMDNLTPSFSTTTTTERIAIQITALESMHAYFEYLVLYPMCGIPEITIKGTPGDWKMLKTKTDALRKYKLDWWIDELDPLLDQFINASENKLDTPFWQNMFKYHTDKHYGAPNVIDGWIIKFFPYDKEGNRNELKMLRSSENLPIERAVVDFELLEQLPDSNFKSSDMHFVAGFLGLKQNHTTQALEPQIGWLVEPKDKNEIINQVNSNERIYIKVSEIPKEFLTLDRIQDLNIEFLDSIKIPAELALKDIKTLFLSGKISNEELRKIKFLFPYTKINILDDTTNFIHSEYGNPIDGPVYNVEKLTANHWKYVTVYSIQSDVDFLEELKDKKINILDIICDTLTAENKLKIVDAYQDSYLIINNKRIQNRQFFADVEARKLRYKQWITENGTGVGK